MANSLELAGAGRGGGESDGGQESGQPQGQTHLTAQAHRHGKTARTHGWRRCWLPRGAPLQQSRGQAVCPALRASLPLIPSEGQLMTTPGAATEAVN